MKTNKELEFVELKENNMKSSINNVLHKKEGKLPMRLHDKSVS